MRMLEQGRMQSAVWALFCTLWVAVLASGTGAVITKKSTSDQHWALHQAAQIINPAGHGPIPQITRLPVKALPGQFTTETFKDTRGRQMTYYIYVPASYTPTSRTQYPIVLILHGTGERGSAKSTPAQNRETLLKQNYVHAFSDARAQAYQPSFVVVPQIGNATDRWVNVPGQQGTYTLQPQPAPSLQDAIDIFATVEHAYPAIDSHRAYLTGISMGAYGVWDAVERWPNLFAAASPLAGAGDPQHARVLKNLPIWDFHGAADTNIPPSGSQHMYAALSAIGADECYTEFPGLTHDLWNSIQVYAQAPFRSWLFAQTRSPAQGQQPPSCVGRVIHGVAAK